MKNQIKRSLKRMFLKSMFYLFLGLTLFFGSCQEQKEDTDPKAVNEPLSQIDAVIDHSSIPIRVENNTLVFSSEDNFQKTIDFLNNISDENFDKWENHYGFISLRKSSNFEKVKEKTDNLFATLLNCNSEIIIGTNKFRIDFDNEKIYASFVDDNLEAKKATEISTGTTTVYDFTDDIFSIIENGNASKGTYCGGRDIASSFPLFGFMGDIIYLRVRYYTIGIYNTVSIRMEQQFTYWDMYINSNLVMGFHTNLGESTWQNNIDSGTFNGIAEERSNPGDLEVRPYARTRRLTYFYLNSDFYASCECAPIYNYALSLSICCHSPGCDH